MDKDSKLLTEAYLSEVATQLKKGDIVELPRNWQVTRGYRADWAKPVTHGKVWGHDIDRDTFLTGQVDVVLLDPRTGDELGQRLGFKPNELKLVQNEASDSAVQDRIDSIVTAYEYEANEPYSGYDPKSIYDLHEFVKKGYGHDVVQDNELMKEVAQRLNIPEAQEKTLIETSFPPIRNQVWNWDPEDNNFSTERSNLRDEQDTDPWGRPVGSGPDDTVEAIRDDEGDITHWNVATTVRGQPVRLIIFND